MTFTSHRRWFLGTLGAAFATPALLAQENTEAAPKLIESLPSLQCPTENGISLIWLLGQPAAGYVEYGTDKNNLDKTAYGDVFGLNAYSRRFMQIRIEGLKPNTRYYYRTATVPFQFVAAYKFERGEPVYSDTFSFETSGINKTATTFSVINDTHNKQPLLKSVGERLRTINADYTVWNGDLVDYFSDELTAVDAVLRPGGSSFATEKPLLFVPGNHDYRGEWARNISQILPPWEQQPNNPSAGRNFVVRTGPLAIIGLDTGEDKPDNRSEWAGLARFEPYRIQQRDWLEKALQSEQVASAPFVLAFCHIPLFDSRTNANGGDQPEGFAAFQRQAGNLWGPLLAKYGVQAVISAHTHRIRYDAPTEDRPWAQIVGGGSTLETNVAVLHGKAEGNKLEIVADSISENKELARWMFAPRQV